MVVVGAPNSSNSQRLREAAERLGCKVSVLVQRAADLDWSLFEGISRLGLSAGASAPDVLIEEIMAAFAERFDVSVSTVTTVKEDMFFPLPRELRPDAA